MSTQTTYSIARSQGTISEQFVTFIRTKQFMKNRLRGENDRNPVHIPKNEISERFFTFPKYNIKHEINKLIDAGEISVSVEQLPNGNTMFMYCVLKPGAINLTLLKPKQNNLDPISRTMKEYLKCVSLPEDAPQTDYFTFFLKHKNNYPDYFFTVDEFAGRVHTPVSSFHRPYRPNILLDGLPTIGLDVTTMQPLLLGKLLKDSIGVNEYSKWIDSGEDIYIKLQTKAGLLTRDEGKKRFFEILFAKPNNSLAAMFGDADWITWINQYKAQPEPRNPHNVGKPYSNVAWLLQTTEVKVMRKVWRKLIHAGIPFLSVHDEVIVKQSDRYQAEQIFRAILDQEFTFYKLNMKQRETINTPPPPQSMPQPKQIQPERAEKPAEPKAEVMTAQDYYNLPIRPATGRLKELENAFISAATRRRGKLTDTENIIRLFDKYKRVEPESSKLDELEYLINT
jgi:hypothetical protein